MQNLKIKLYNKTAALSWSLTPVLPVVVFVVASLLFTGSQTALATGSIQPQSTFPDTSDYDYPPDSVATDAAGNVYVAYSGEPVLRKYDSTGSLITNISLAGSPSGVAIDSDGDIFIEDGDTGSIKKYNSAGVLQAEWGQYGGADGEFTSFGGISIDSSGNVFVVDTDAHRIQKFDNNGTYLTKWGTNGSGDGQFNRPGGVTVDLNTNAVFVADLMNHRIQKFDNNGTYVTKWGSSGSGNGQFQYPWKLTSDSSGNVFVTDVFNYRIQKFNSSGTYLTKWGSYGTGDGQFNSYPQGGIAVGTGGHVYFADSQAHKIQEFDNGGVFVQNFINYILTEFTTAQDLAVHGNYVYVADTGHNRVMVFDKNTEQYAFSWGSAGSGDGQFNGLYAIETDSQGNVYAADGPWSNARIQKFDSAGNYLLQWGSFGSGNGEFMGIPGIAIDSYDNIYVLDSGNNRIQKFDSAGNYLLQWGTPGGGNGEFYLNHWVESSNGITVDSQDNVYVSDSGNARIQKFDSAGNYILQWGSFGDGDSQFKYQRGIAADPQDNIYVLDVWASSRDMLKKFDSSGNFLSLAYGYTFGFSNGNSDDQYPQNLDIDTDGDIFAIDTGASDIKRMEYVGVLSIDYQYLDSGYFNQAYQQFLSVSDAAGPVTYSVSAGVLPPGLSLDSNSGEISGTSTDPVDGSYVFTIEATDGVNTDSLEFDIYVFGDPTPPFYITTSNSLGTGIKNLPYDEAIEYVNAQGAVSYSIVAGSLPPGLYIQDMGGSFKLVGIPTLDGDYSFTLRLDDGNTTTEKQFDVYIYGVSDADIGIELSLGSSVLTAGQQAQYNLTFTNYGPEAMGTQAYMDFLIGVIRIPDELQFVSASPTLGMSCYELTPDNLDQESLYGSGGYLLACENYMNLTSLASGASATMSISVMATQDITDETVVKAMAYGIGDPDYLEAYEIIQASQDVNLYELDNNNTCVYTGIHGGSCRTTMSIVPQTLPNTDWVGESPGYYSQQLQSGKDPYAQYSVVSGALPDGISLASDGLLSGYAAVPGIYAFEVLAYENSQWTTSRQLSITVPSMPEPDPISIITTSLSDGTVGEYYSDYIYSDNIDGTVTYSVIGGQLPSGLLLQTVGDYAHLYGTPTTEGQWTFTVQAQDSANTANKTLTIVVRPAPVARLVITTSELSDGVVGDEYEDFVNVGNVYQSVSFSIVGGSLPAGLEFEDAGGFARIHGTPTTEGQWTFTVQAQDSANTDQKIYFISIYDRDPPDVPPVGSNEEENPPQEEVKTEDPVSGTERLGHAEGVAPVQGKKRHLSPVAERLVVFFPWLVIILLGVVAAVYTLQALAQNRAAKRLRSDLDHQEQLVHEKKNFMALASHYMRTPITIIKSAVELAIHDVPLEHVGTVQGALSQLETHVGSLVDDISSDAALQQVVPPSDIAYRQSRPWSPQVLLPVSVAVVSLITGWLLTSYYTFITQSIATRIVIGLSTLLLIGILYLLSEWHKRTVFEAARAEQLEMYQMSIDRARNGFISSAAESIAQPLADFEECFKNPQIVEALQGGPALKMILRAIGELRGTISKFALAGQLEHKMLPAQLQTVTASMLTTPAIQKVVETHPTVQVQSTLPAEHLYALEAPSLFANAFENVVENAANYNISSVPVVVAQEQAGEQIAITVEDHGVGIEPGKLSVLFKPFGRAEDAEDFSHQGIGMGLYLTRLILDYLGGTVSAESQPGKGTKVRLSLPQSAR